LCCEKELLLRQEELAFIKAISTQHSPAVHRELEGRRGQWCLTGAAAPGLELGPEPPYDHLDSSRTSENHQPGKLALGPRNSNGRTNCHQQTASRAARRRVTYAVSLTGAVAPFQPSGSLKPTAAGSEPTQPAVSSETAERLVFSEMSGPLSDKPDGTAPHAQVTTPAYQQESVLKIRQFLL
jgi:hypothetical protein